MAFNSINTNAGAVVALQALNRTNDQLDVTQKRVSTGYRVADARDDGGAFAVAQKVRGDIAGVTSANEQLGAAKGLLDTTLSGLNRVSDTMATIRAVVVKLADNNVQGALRTSYTEQYNALRNQVGSFINDSTYNGVSLLGVSGNETGQTTTPAASGITVIRNEVGGEIDIAAANTAAFDLQATFADAAAATTYLTSPTGLAAVEQSVNSALNTYGNSSKTVTNQIAFNKDKIDALESGLGALIDADLAKESARLQSLQIRQQLGATALSAANSAPQFLLSLFR